MQKKNVWLIIVFSLILIILLISSYYLFFLKNKVEIELEIFFTEQNLLENQEQTSKYFLDFLAQKEKLPQSTGEVSLIAVGDISYSRAVERAVKQQQDIFYPFLKIRDYFKSADFVFGNLETPITAGPEIPDFEMIFRSNPGTEQVLKEVGFSILSLANNHTMNFGEKGLKDTFNFLDKVEIKYVGAGNNELEAHQPIFLEKNGIKFAFLAYNDSDVVPTSYEASASRAGTAFMRTEKMVEAVKQAKQQADFVIVSMHSGIEYVNNPNNSQINFAHSAIEAGADLIIGHHPHVVQTLEKYKGKFIFYSLGNFIFDQPQSTETKESLIVKIYFSENEISKISFLPVFMEKLAQPRLANKNEADKILQRLNYTLEKQAVYFWNTDQNDFEKTTRGIIYNKDFKNNKKIYKQELADLDNDSILENYVLENGQLSILINEEIVWQSPNDWWIEDFVLADSTNDGIIDINLSLYKSGNFGSSQPFWIKENDPSIKNHFFVLNFIDKSVKIIWGSSNLTQPNCQFKIADINNDGKNDLIVLEGDYKEDFTCSANHLAVWQWNGWGFSNEWRSELGNFSNLEIQKIAEKNYLVVDTR